MLLKRLGHASITHDGYLLTLPDMHQGASDKLTVYENRYNNAQNFGWLTIGTQNGRPKYEPPVIV